MLNLVSIIIFTTNNHYISENSAIITDNSDNVSDNTNNTDVSGNSDTDTINSVSVTINSVNITDNHNSDTVISCSVITITGGSTAAAVAAAPTCRYLQVGHQPVGAGHSTWCWCYY